MEFFDSDGFDKKRFIEFCRAYKFKFKFVKNIAAIKSGCGRWIYFKQGINHYLYHRYKRNIETGKRYHLHAKFERPNFNIGYLFHYIENHDLYIRDKVKGKKNCRSDL